MLEMINNYSSKFFIVFVMSCALMAYLGSKQYKLLSNGDVRRVFKDRFYEILSVVFSIINWPLFMVRESKAIEALQRSGVSEVLLNVEEDKSIGTVAVMLVLFPIIFFCFGKLASLVKLGRFYDWEEPAEDVVEKDKEKEDK
ncbi:hypothetical protein IKF20_03355 [Candidatus Saccharibacteria bacterium]|nr:hypothetical protein [Candidatus Saccharibacteria bacterium]